ncbi:MAG: SulP family inorganic anion transporter [Chitinophagaceae bacterium]
MEYGFNHRGSIETLLCIEAADKMDPYKRFTKSNVELKAQGVGNMLSGLLGGLPLTSVVVRTTANVDSGGKTKIAAIAHGIFLLIAVLLIPTILNKIPLAALASILIMVGYKLASAEKFKHQWQKGINQFIPFIITFLAIVFTNLLVGIMIGLSISILFILYTNSKIAYSFNKNEHKDGEAIEIKLAQEVTFLNKAAIKQTLQNLPQHAVVIINASDSFYIDEDVLELIKEFEHDGSKSKHIQVQLKGFRESYKIENSLKHVKDTMNINYFNT